MTPLRQRLLEDMPIRNLASSTPRAYVEHVSRFVRHFGRSPARLGPEEIRADQSMAARPSESRDHGRVSGDRHDAGVRLGEPPGCAPAPCRRSVRAPSPTVR